MFLEFWLNLFIKIAVDENVFLSLNSREIAGNEGFSKKIGVNGGKITKRILVGRFRSFIYHIYSVFYDNNIVLGQLGPNHRMNRAFKGTSRACHFKHIKNRYKY